jgi:hypothetical protein
MPRGASAPTLTPHHSGTGEQRKGGPLWLQLQGYFVLLTLRQDHLPVLATTALVTHANRVSRQVRPVSDRSGGGEVGAHAARFGGKRGG